MTNMSDLYLPIAEKSSPPSVEDHEPAFRIGNLAREFDVTLRTLRFYEDKGLLTPKRVGTTRLYSNCDRTRLKLILFSKKIGFSLVEIRQILEVYDENKHLQNPMASARAQFQDKLATLTAQKFEIEEAIDELSRQLGSEYGMFGE